MAATATSTRFLSTTAGRALSAAGVGAAGWLIYQQNQQQQQQQPPSWPDRRLHLDNHHHANTAIIQDSRSVQLWRPPTRQAMLAQLKQAESSPQEPYDLLVIGGGATGTGVAVDAAARGLRVALVERDDFSAGTSSKSTKLVHGGVRYLEKAVWGLDYEQYAMVKEALHERRTVMHVAPYLTSALPIMCPIYKWWQAPYYWLGTKAYDLVAGKRALEASYWLSPTRALQEFPMLKQQGLCGAVVYYDGQQNDSRMNVVLALTAAFYGATMVNHCAVTELRKNAQGKLCGAKVRDQMTGEEITVHAKGVVNATGPFVDGIRRMDDPQCPLIIAPSSGTHIVLPHYYSPHHMGLIDPATSDGRVIFFLPWEGNTVAGTTDEPTEVTYSPTPKEKEISFILNEVSHYLSGDIMVRRGDVLSAWTGIRPLVRNPKAANTQSLVRNHLLLSSDSGLLTIGGGKWTTYRRMAEETVDEAIKLFDLSPKRPCETEELLMIGSHGYSPNAYIRLIQHFGMESEVAQHLLHNYGDRAFEVASVATQTERRWPVTGVRLSYPYLFIEAEVRYACRREWACTAVDVLARRTRLAFLSAQAAEEALPRVIEIMAEELGWDAKRKEQERQDALEFLLTMGWTPDKHRSFKSDELAFYKQEFRELDQDQDGLVTSEELRGLFQRTSKSISPEQLRLLIANVEMHKNGVVGFDEFLEMMMGGEVIVTEGGMRPTGVDGGGV